MCSMVCKCKNNLCACTNLNRLVDCVMVAWDHNSMGLLNFKYSRKCEALQFKGIKQID